MSAQIDLEVRSRCALQCDKPVAPVAPIAPVTRYLTADEPKSALGATIQIANGEFLSDLARDDWHSTCWQSSMPPTRRFNKILSIFVGALLIVASAGPSAYAAPVLITFEDISGMTNNPGSTVPVASQLSNDYLALSGVLFGSASPFVAVVNLGDGTVSPTNGIGGVDALGRLSYATPIDISFFDAGSGLPGVTDFVSIRGDTIPIAGSATMTAFDINGVPIGTTTALDMVGGLTLTLNIPGIHRVNLTETSATIAFDNLQFNLAAAAPTAVPEPGSLLLLGTGGFGLLAKYRRRNRRLLN